MDSAPTSYADQNANDSPAFEVAVASVLQEVHCTLAAVLAHLRPPVSRAADLRRLLNLDQQLSWSIFNAATATDTRALASLLPGRRAMERFFAAAALRGAPDAVIDRARAAIERFEESVARHARSRDAFEVMVAGLGGDSAQAKHKRGAFRTLSLLWGRQARAGFGSIVVHPSAQPGMLDWLIIKGLTGLHQTRRGTPLSSMTRVWWMPSQGDPAHPTPLEAIDPRESSPQAVGLLRDFCSQPPPNFQVTASEQGFTCHELIADGLGTTSEVTYFTGHAVRAYTSMTGSAPGPQLTLRRGIDTPLETDIGDVILHESIWDEQLPEVKVHAFPPHRSELRDSDLLPLTEKAVYLGRGLVAGWTPLIPQYAEMFSYAMTRMGWNPEEFRIFRCQVDYPLLHSCITMKFQR